MLADAIDATPWIDTHEHLVEESGRLGAQPFTFVDVWGEPCCIPGDWTALIAHYAVDDLVSAGLPSSTAARIIGGDLDPLEKWDAVAPFMSSARLTGYLRAVDLTTERLFGMRLARETCEEIDRRCRDLRTPGYYKHVLRDVANVERCHVNSLEHDPFCETAQPDLLQQDVSLFPLLTGRASAVEAAAGIEIGTLDDYVDLLEWCIDRFASRAVAAKLLWAYFRPLAAPPVDAPPRRAFQRLRNGDAGKRDRRHVEDFLLHRALALAAEYRLPVKLHLGYLAGNRRPTLAGAFAHPADVVPLLHSHPRTVFVLMHIAWPQQEQLLSLAKHFPNAIVDLCWSWILAPLATEEFVRRFLTSVPATKLLCFGGDYLTVETVVGHAEIARRGLQAALERLVEDDWLSIDDALALVPQLMRRNADRIFPARATTRRGPDRGTP